MENEVDNDAALMLKVQEGDFAAFEALVDKYKQPVTNIVARIIRDKTEAEDLAQNVFLQVYKASGRYRVTAKFSTWLFTIARNLSLNELRRRSRHPASSLDAPVGGEDDDMPARQIEDRQVSSAADQALNAELVEKIDQVLGELPINQRTAIILVKEKGLSYDDIAGILGCSVSAVKSLIHRGRETIKGRIKPYLVSGTWDATTK
ncbi:sigma-70 family RNA polymerase sigma factor [bacterium]|jgi:RNA polymerase sigma-70 factor, ECF subfamily|nr:sigma-70 family RNA polymerase sigma factor [Verrucomicrobiota bacterium]MDA7510805.1 sigma-70 family RNA polymerase sigma factor [Verrucomicrobiota bacterium]MDA7632614.1 sigma-70 family RNA polymerase sigma factor [bacterium]MDA7657124.1 sigma-70 family RNA polymerase sigma factor [Verrucomicrobiota bacterium]